MKKERKRRKETQGGKHLRGETHGKRVVSTHREGFRKREDQKGKQPTARE